MEHEYPPDIEHHIEKRIKGRSDTVCVWEKQLDDTCNNRSQVETTMSVCKHPGLGTPKVRGREQAKITFLSIPASVWPLSSVTTNEKVTSRPIVEL